ncbi:MAG TPA: CoA transferase [Actinomycetota bacterium]|nr:CoA transferase [Actinomycetota bacterium]
MRPLEDVRVIALEQYGAGPFGSLHLADLGAEIIKIEDPSTGGDVGRYVPPFQHEQDSLFFETFNRNKRSIVLDVTNPAGREVLEDLIRVSDAMYSNLRGDVPERLRITYEHLKSVNGKIVCVSLTGFGMTGPRKAEPGYDYVLQGLAGWMSLTGEPDGPPAKSGLSLVDYIGGIVAALSLVSGIHAARRDGRGMDCDVSLYDAAIGMLTYPAVWHLNAGFTPARHPRSAHPSLVPFQLFPTADGWIVVGCAKEKFWQRLAAALDKPELASDDRFKDFAARNDNRDELIAILDEAFMTKTGAAWLSLLAEAGVPCGPVNDVEQAFADSHTEARGLIVETEHPRFGIVRQPASPVRVGEPAASHRRAPRLGEDEPYVLGGLLGYGETRIASLRDAGAFGAPR